MKLHGSPVSNYYNVVKTALIEKGVAFEEAPMKPGDNEYAMARSPLGKIPVLETENGYLSESLAILTYIDKKFPQGPQLFPADPWLAGRAMQIHNMIDIYGDLNACRKLLGAAFFGREISDEARDKAVADYQRVVQGLKQLTDLENFAVGDSLTHADLGFFWQSRLCESCMSRLGLPKYMAENLPGYKAYVDRMVARESVARSARDMKAAMDAFLAG